MMQCLCPAHVPFVSLCVPISSFNIFFPLFYCLPFLALHFKELQTFFLFPAACFSNK